MTRPPRMTLGILVISCATSVGAAEVSQRRLDCVPPSGHARVGAQLPEGFSAASVRVYFRAPSAREDHFIEMRRGAPGSYWAVLPAPSAGTASVAYRIVARGASGEVIRSKVEVAPVYAPCPMALADEELRSARNIVIGLSSRAQPVVPPGFECRGIVARISADGDLTAYPACAEAGRVAMLARAEPTPTPCPGCGTLTIGGTSPVVVGPPCETCGTLGIGGTGGYGYPTSPPPPPPPTPTPTPPPPPPPTPTPPPVSGFRPTSTLK